MLGSKSHALTCLTPGMTPGTHSTGWVDPRDLHLNVFFSESSKIFNIHWSVYNFMKLNLAQATSLPEQPIVNSCRAHFN